MLYSIKNRDHLEKLNEIVSLQNQVKALRLQDKQGNENVHEAMKKVFKLVLKSIRNVSQEITKTITETSKGNNKALEKINNELLEFVNARGILASYLLPPPSKLTNPEHTSHFKLVKDPRSHRVNVLLINKTKPKILYNNFLLFRITDGDFELQDLLKMITKKTYNADLGILLGKKFMYEFAK